MGKPRAMIKTSLPWCSTTDCTSLSLYNGSVDGQGNMARLQPLGHCNWDDPGMCCAASSCICIWLLLSRGIYLCGHSAGAHLAAMVLSTDWTEFGVVPDIRGSALRDPCSGGLVFSTRGLHPGISHFTVLQSVKLITCFSWLQVACTGGRII